MRRKSCWIKPVIHMLSAVLLVLSVGSVHGVHPPPVYPADYSQFLKDGDTFDFIVAGAGASGSVVAARLSELGASVLLVEAGGNPDIRSRIPSLSMTLMASNDDWLYPTLPNGKSCLSSEGKQCPFSRGKMLGGSTSMNYMMYTRGNRRDYDDWNIRGWAWNDLEKYFLKSENLIPFNSFPNSSKQYHSTNGTVKIDFFDNSENSWHQRLLSGYEDLKFPYNMDVNGKSQIGVSKIVGFVNDGERESAATAYLSPAVTRDNLKVSINTYVTKVIMDSIKNKAVGVTVLINKGKQIDIYTRKEVILSTGAIGTPQILLLSGIGPEKHLNEMRIPVRVNLPDVGNGLSDHVLPLILIEVDRGFGVDFPNMIPFVKDGVFVTKWCITNNGEFASNGLTDVTAFINTDCYDFVNHKLKNTSNDNCQLPTLQFIHAYLDRNTIAAIKPIFENSIRLESDIIDQISDANIHQAFIIISPTLLTPKSTGRIELNCTDPTVKPNIFANYLDQQYDVDELIKAFKIVDDLVATKEFKDHNARILRLKFKNCPDAEFGTDEYRECYVRHMTHSVYHGVCTTALGKVVDEKLKVKGVEGLRVADGGIIPRLPRGNTAATCITIGEKAGELISQEHNLHGKPTINHLNMLPASVQSLPGDVAPQLL